MVAEIVLESRWVQLYSTILFPVVGVFLILCGIHYWFINTRIYKLGSKLPGPRPLPFVGNAHMVLPLKNNHEVVEKAIEICNEYGNIIRAWLGFKLIVGLIHPADVEIILNSQVHIDKSNEYRFFKPWLGDGLLISTGDRWRSHRKLMAPAFHMNVLKTFMAAFNANSLAIVTQMKKEIGGEFDVHDYMSTVTVDILLETAMGSKKTSENKAGFDYAMAVMKMCDILHQRHYKFWYRFDTLFNLTNLREKQENLLGIIHGLTKQVIKTKKNIFYQDASEGKLPSPSFQEILNDTKTKTKTTKNSKTEVKGLRDDLDDLDENDVGEKRRPAFLDLMIETAYNGANLDDEDIKQEVDTIMFEGHDTTAAGSSFVLCLLGCHQDIQEKVMVELKQIFGDSDRPVTFNDTLEMKYLERVIFESLRMFPPVPVIARQLNQDIKLVSKDVVVPAGATVLIGTYKIHRRPDVYDNPEKFDPDNFLPERMANRHFYSFIPFSAGPRSCIGRKYAMLKLKVLIATVLRHYKVVSKVPEKDFKLCGDIILKRADGFRLFIEPRNLIKTQ